MSRPNKKGSLAAPLKISRDRDDYAMIEATAVAPQKERL